MNYLVKVLFYSINCLNSISEIKPCSQLLRQKVIINTKKKKKISPNVFRPLIIASQVMGSLRPSLRAGIVFNVYFLFLFISSALENSLKFILLLILTLKLRLII